MCDFHTLLQPQTSFWGRGIVQKLQKYTFSQFFK